MSRVRRNFAGMPPADRAVWLALAVIALLAAALIALQDPEETPGVRAPAPVAATTPAEPREPAVVAASEPLLLGDTAVRAIRATRTGRTLTVVLRVRNNTGRTQRLDAGGFRLAVERVEPASLPSTSVPDGESVTVRARFAAPDASRLDVTAWDDGGTGTIRLEVEGA